MKKILIFSFGALFLCLLQVQIVSAGADDFEFESMHVDYYLTKNEANRSQVQINETLKPIFPDFDQNRGIIRMIPLEYDNHSLNFKLQSVKRDGVTANLYKNEKYNNHQKLMIRDHENDYLHGLHQYDISYYLHDVTHRPTDANIDEFYWDVNGNSWSQKFKSVTAKIKIDDGIYANLLKDRIACYTGELKSTKRNCIIELNHEQKTINVATTEPLLANETLTFALGFKQNTFEAYQMTTIERSGYILGYIILIGTIIGTLIGISRALKLPKSTELTKPIVTQYLPHEKSNFYFDSGLISNSKATVAQLINLAVNHKIKIIERDKKNGYERKEHALQVEKISLLNKDDMEFLKIFYGHQPSDKEETKIKQQSSRISRNLNKYNSGRQDVLTKFGLYQNLKTDLKKINPWLISSVLSFFVIFLLIPHPSSFLWWTALGNITVAAIGIITINGPRLTRLGAEYKSHLLGLRKYIEAAEKDRLEFNQGFETAKRQLEKEVQLNIKHSDSKSETTQYKIVLFERLLPYAILFGLEKSWMKELKIITQENPDYAPNWYVGGNFNIGDFNDNFLSDFSSSVSAYSSSSSGSGGGGSAGGGGGGGGGGGC